MAKSGLRCSGCNTHRQHQVVQAAPALWPLTSLHCHAALPLRSPCCQILLQCGVGHLARVLNTLLVEHIRGLLPSLRGKIEVALAARRRELAMYGDSPPGSSSAARGGLLLTVLDSYANRFRCVFDLGCGVMLLV